MTASIVALIPARGGSTRIPRKNLADLNGHPLIAYTIASAQQSGVFSGVYVSTEDAEIAECARHYGAMVIDRPSEFAADLAPDIGWVVHVLETLRRRSGTTPDAFAILRPTSPFRSPETIRAAWEHLQHHGPFAVDSLRAVEKPKQHPLKMWIPAGELIFPFADWIRYQIEPHPLAPAHSQPAQTFFPVYAQNASLEMAWSRVAIPEYDGLKRIANTLSISGERVLPWLMPGFEGVDINQPEDLDYARWLIETKRATLPGVVHG